jgi:anti-sigma-K factor RskA
MKINNNELRSMLAAEYVLGTLTGHARSRFETYMQRDPRFQILVDKWSIKLAPMGTILPSVNPSRRVWKAIERRLNLKQQIGIWNSLNLWRGFTAAATTVVLVMAIYIGVKQPAQLEPVYVAVVQNQQAQGAWLISAQYEKNQLLVKNIKPQELAGNKDFELWLIPANKQPPISMGLISANKNTTLAIRPEVRKALRDAPAMAVSLEPRGGSKTGAPTGPVLYQGSITTI